MRMLESTRAGSRGLLSLVPCVTLPGPKTALGQTRLNRWFPTWAAMPETWFFYRVIVLLLTKKWRLERETSYSNSRGAISQGYFYYFLKSPLSASHRSPGRTRVSLQSLDGAGRHVGSVKVASPGRPDEPPASLLWASGTRGAQGKPGKPNFAISLPSSAG